MKFAGGSLGERIERRPWRTFVLLLGGVLLLHLWRAVPSEPFYNNDETRHLLTGIFFRDFLRDLPFSDPLGYAKAYYLRAPALGLLVWPPFFHVVEGGMMGLFGAGLLTGKVTVGLFAVLAGGYLFALARVSEDTCTAAVALLLFLLFPIVFALSRQVMLEVPALGLSLAALYHFVRHLEGEGRRDLFLSALFSALAFLTRYDAFVLLPTFLLLLLLRRKLGVLLRREVWAAAGLGLLLTLPYTLFMVRHIGAFHLRQATETMTEGSTHLFALENFGFYLRHIPDQISWCGVVLVLAGLGGIVAKGRSSRALPHLVLIGTTWVTFSAMAELEVRHTIYWTPAFAFLGAVGVRTFVRRGGVGSFGILLLLAGALLSGIRRPAPYLHGYAEAARHIVRHPDPRPLVLFDGWLDGNFIYQIGRLDGERRWWVLRGDKIFFSVLTPTNLGYREYVRDEAEMLARIFACDPAYLVVESPYLYRQNPTADRLRQLLATHPERFRLERSIPLRSNHPFFQKTHLLVYRNLLRNPEPQRSIEIEVRMLGERIGGDPFSGVSPSKGEDRRARRDDRRKGGG